MKVCYLTTSYPRYPGDFAGVFHFWFHRELIKRGVEVHVIAPGADGAKPVEVWEGVKIHRFNYFFPRNLQRVAYGSGILGNLRKDLWAWIGMPFFLFSFFLKTLRVGWGCDLIHCFWSPTILIALPLAKLRGKRLVLSVLGSDIRHLPRLLNRFIFALTDEIIAPATEIYERLEKFGVKNYQVISSPVDESKFHRQRNFSSVSKEFGLREEWVVTFVARLDEFKDPLTFIRAIPEILSQIENVRFFVVGDGALRIQAEELVRRFRLQDVVYIAGFRGDVDEFLGVSHIFVALSPIENTWSSTIAEAMFMEVPCIITDAGYSSKLFTHGENCILIPPRDECALADSVVRLIRDPRLRACIAKGGRELLQRYRRTIPEITQSTLDLYQGLLSRRKAGHAVARTR
jgi:glycosyltransferase involved in cell wall biosynthesis